MKIIQRFVKLFDSFGYYKERIVPKLSPIQQKKHLDFAKLVHERKWDLFNDRGEMQRGKNGILLIHYDE